MLILLTSRQSKIVLQYLDLEQFFKLHLGLRLTLFRFIVGQFNLICFVYKSLEGMLQFIYYLILIYYIHVLYFRIFRFII